MGERVSEEHGEPHSLAGLFACDLIAYRAHLRTWLAEHAEEHGGRRHDHRAGRRRVRDPRRVRAHDGHRSHLRQGSAAIRRPDRQLSSLAAPARGGRRRAVHAGARLQQRVGPCGARRHRWPGGRVAQGTRWSHRSHGPPGHAASLGRHRLHVGPRTRLVRRRVLTLDALFCGMDELVPRLGADARLAGPARVQVFDLPARHDREGTR